MTEEETKGIGFIDWLKRTNLYDIWKEKWVKTESEVSQYEKIY